MGSYISCSPYKGAEAAVAQVVVPGGETQTYSGQIKAADIMLEHFSMYFVVNEKSLHVGQRFCPLSADEDLELGESYIMFPMKRANSVVTAADVAPQDQSVAACDTKKSSYGFEGFEPVLGLIVEMNTGNGRLSSCRSRRPSLETIVEEKEPHHIRWEQGC